MVRVFHHGTPAFVEGGVLDLFRPDAYDLWSHCDGTLASQTVPQRQIATWDVHCRGLGDGGVNAIVKT
jgi:hypothetical protein